MAIHSESSARILKHWDTLWDFIQDEEIDRAGTFANGGLQKLLLEDLEEPSFGTSLGLEMPWAQ